MLTLSLSTESSRHTPDALKKKKTTPTAIGSPSKDEIKRRIKSSMTNERAGKLFLMIPVCAPRETYVREQVCICTRVRLNTHTYI